MRVEVSEDGVYVTLREGTFKRTQDAGDLVLLDYDEDDNLLGVEVLFARSGPIEITGMGEGRKLPAGTVLRGDFVKRDGTHSDTYLVRMKHAR